jgi:hypothetical protein
MKTYQIKVTYIAYVYEESIDERIMDIICERHGTIDPDSIDYLTYMEEHEKELKRMEEARPTTLDLEITCNRADLDREINSAVYNATGWCFDTVRYEIISER